MQVRPVTDTDRISNVIKKHRKEKGISQKELAKILDVTRNTIDNYEHGRCVPSMEVLKATHEKLSVPYEVLFGETEKDETFIKYSSLTKKDQELIDALIERLSSKP